MKKETWKGYKPIFVGIKGLKARFQVALCAILRGRIIFRKVEADKAKTVVKKVNYWLEKYGE
jgi:hypothetical protein